MDYKRIHEIQYTEQKLVIVPQNRYFGLRKILKVLDKNRYMIVGELSSPGKRYLDIGCGNGDMLILLKEKYEELYGLDITPSRLKYAQAEVEKKYPSEAKKFKFLEGDTNERLSFPDNFFSTITLISVIEHIYDIFTLLKELNRITAAGGYVIAQVPNIAYLKQRISLLFGKIPITSSPFNWGEIGWDGGHIHYFTLNKFLWLFESNGFGIVKKSGSGFLAPLRNWWPSMLCGDLIVKAQKI